MNEISLLSLMVRTITIHEIVSIIKTPIPIGLTMLKLPNQEDISNVHIVTNPASPAPAALSNGTAVDFPAFPRDKTKPHRPAALHKPYQII